MNAQRLLAAPAARRGIVCVLHITTGPTRPDRPGTAVRPARRAL